jgi:chromosome segregation ATPase
MQQREAGLVQDRDALRSALAAVRLELVEAANASAKREAEFSEVAKALSVRTAEADRRSRENDTLREKHVRLSIDLDKAQKREAEARRRLDELSTIHANDAARHSELLAALGKSEKDETRLQKSLEIMQAKLSEMTEATRIAEDDREAERARTLAEIRGLRSEIQSLQSRLDVALSKASEASGEIARLTAQWSDTMAEKQVADERYSDLMKESEADKLSISRLTADLSQISVQYASEQMQSDIQRQECEDMRGEIAALSARVKELLPYERLHKVTSAREREGVVGVGSVAAEPARPRARRRSRTSLRAAS